MSMELLAPGRFADASRTAVEICFRISAIENLVQKILESLARITYGDRNDIQMTKNLKSIVDCLLQTRGCINHKYNHESTVTTTTTAMKLPDTKITAKFDSRMIIQGLDMFNHDLVDSFDVRDALTYTVESVTVFGGMEQSLDHSKLEDFFDSSTRLNGFRLNDSSSTSKFDGGDKFIISKFEDQQLDSKEDMLLPLKDDDACSATKMNEIVEEIKVECVDDVGDSDTKWETDMEHQFLISLKEDPFADEDDADDDTQAASKRRRRKRGTNLAGPGQHKCDKCGVAFHDEEFLRQHEAMFVHDKHRCEVCAQTFSWKKDFDAHNKTESHLVAEAAVSAADMKVRHPSSSARQRDSHEDEGGGGEGDQFDDVGGDDDADDGEEELDDVDEVERNGGHPAPDNEVEEKINLQESSGGTGSLHECDICGKMVTQLSIHRRIHLGDKPYSCNVCGKRFLRRNNMRNHRLKHGPRERIYCRTCGKGFLNRVSIKKHLMKDGGCDRSQLKELKGSSVQLEEDGSPPTEEKEPPTKLPKEEEEGVKPKVKKKYFQNNPMLECEVCGKVMNRSNLYKHRRVHTGEKPYKCEMCEKAFISKFNLKLHISTHHSVREKMLCQTCGVGFLSQYSLKKHVCGKLKQKKETKDISCPICGKQVKAEGGLKCHMKIHTEERPYTCEVCGDSFRRPYEINIHKMRAHDNPKCEICATSFTTISALNRHQQNVHSDKKRFSCDVCGKGFKEKRSLIKHGVVHNKDEHVKCKCEVCPKSFFFLSDLRKHYQKVHKLDINMQMEKVPEF